MVSYLIGLIVVAVTIYYACFLESTALVMLGFAEALVCMLSFASLIIKLHTVKVGIEVPISIAEKDRPFDISLRIENAMPLGCKLMKFKVVYGNTIHGKSNSIWVSAENITIGKSEYSYEITISTPGNYEFNIKKVRIYDLFGLFHINKRLAGTASAMVLPTISELPVSVGERVRNYAGETDFYDELRPGYEVGETFGVREFRPGDKLPRVHWKLSAKVDDLMIKENTRSKSCAVVMFLNPDVKNYDELLKKAVGLSFSLMDAGCPHYASWISKARGDIVRTRVDDEESFFTFLVSFMQDCSVKPGTDITGLYRDKYRGEKGLHEFVFENGNIYQNGNLLEGEGLSEILIN